MTVRATIAEFNPFHNGHKRLIDAMKEDGAAAVAVMSGNYVQRGGCSVYDKFTRAKVAVSCGLDLVLELPLLYSLSSAENFATGAVEILNGFSLIDELWFGSEACELAPLAELADALTDESDAFREALSAALSEGLSFAAARQRALTAVLGEKAAAIAEPNNILGVEYLKALLAGRRHRPLGPRTLERRRALRESLKTGESIDSYVPYPPVFRPVFSKSFDQLIAYRLKIASVDELTAIADCNEEIAARLKKAAHGNSLESIVAAAHSRRYADSRLRRVLFNLVLGSDGRYRAPSYIRPLAFSERGAELLRSAADAAKLPIASRGGSVKDDPVFCLECRGTDVYNLAIGRLGGEEFMYYPSVQK